MARCPRRDEIGGIRPRFLENVNRDCGPNKKCHYCGSMSPEAFLAAMQEGVEIGPTDKSYKAYVGNQKFYFQHFSHEQWHIFIGLMNDGFVKMGYPGHFYVLPFGVSQ